MQFKKQSFISIIEAPSAPLGRPILPWPEETTTLNSVCIIRLPF